MRALDGTDFETNAGEIHALLGENGAGKSTLIKALCGLCRPGAGEMRLDGRAFSPRSPRDAERAGLSVVHQEIDLVPTLSIADNLALGREPTRFGLIRRGQAHLHAAQAVARLGVSVDPGRTLGECTVAVQQLVAIARALDLNARVLILDEPTSSLDAAEASRSFGVLRGLRERGLAIVLVTHFLDHVYAHADRITVLRNGRRIGVWRTMDLSRRELVEAMTGRSMDTAPTRTAERAVPSDIGGNPSGGGHAAGVALQVTEVGRARTMSPVSFSLAPGEALGLAGLLGSGRSEVARLVFGADRPDTGTVQAAGRSVRPGSVRDAIAHGLVMTPEDRKAQGLVLNLSVRENIVLALQARRGAARPIPARTQGQLAAHYIKTLRIRTPSPETPVGSLSGGNQQKVLLARWLAVKPSVLILDEPTRGIDVGARAEIEALIADLRSRGLGVVLISAEIDELVRVCGRLLVLRERHFVGELRGPDVREDLALRMIAEPPESHTTEVVAV